MSARRMPVAQINVVVMTAIVYYLYFGIEFNGGGLIPGSGSDWRGFFAARLARPAAIMN